MLCTIFMGPFVRAPQLAAINEDLQSQMELWKGQAIALEQQVLDQSSR